MSFKLGDKVIYVGSDRWVGLEGTVVQAEHNGRISIELTTNVTSTSGSILRAGQTIGETATSWALKSQRLTQLDRISCTNQQNILS